LNSIEDTIGEVDDIITVLYEAEISPTEYLILEDYWSYAEIPSSSDLTFSGDFSLALWIKRTAIQAAAEVYISKIANDGTGPGV